MSRYDIYRTANQRLEALIDTNPTHDPSLRAVQARAAERLKAMAAFLDYLGDPHRAAPVIHVGGTSGKGSTATAIAAILRATGRSTLLHTSPFLQVATEKLQIDGQLIDAPLFAELTAEVIDAAGRYGQSTSLWRGLDGDRGPGDGPAQARCRGDRGRSRRTLRPDQRR